MDAERWQRLSPLLDELLELDAEFRVHRLKAIREEDPGLADELEKLVQLEDASGDFLSQPAINVPLGPRPGSEIGPYRLERLLGEGGMGQVWAASRSDGLYQRRVALKLLRPGLADTSLRLRFTRERQILARLAHPHIARLLDAGMSRDAQPYLALEYVEGEPITDYCRNQKTPLEARLVMFQQICDAVSHAHANLIVHRDLKPSNIMVTPGGEVRLLDFGIAKLLDSEAPVIEQTRTGVRAFTLHYAAPEQIRGEPVTTMTDVYSLGVVLYELLTDCKPYRLKRNTDAEWEEAILAKDPLRPSQTVMRNADNAVGAEGQALRRRSRRLTGDLDNIVLKTLSKKPEHRYPSVEALALDLQRYGNGRPVHARAQSVGYRLRKYVQRHRWSLASGLLTAAALSAALAMVAWQARQSLAEASRAQAMQDFMVGVFEQAGGNPHDKPLDLRALLITADERGQRELARQPRARAELLGVLARLRSGLGDYREAQQLLQRQADLIADTPGIPVSLSLESLTQRGEMLRRLGNTPGCITLMQTAMDTARREQGRLPPQVAEFYSQLGRCRRANGEQSTARQLFERALALRRENPGNEIAEVESRLDLAGLHADAGRTVIALNDYEAARTQLRRVAGDRHPLLIEIGRNLGSLQRARDRLPAAERELTDALAIALDTRGPQHPITLQVRRELADAMIEQGRFRDAALQLRMRHAMLAARLGTNHPDLRDSHYALARVEWELDRPGAAEAALQAVVASSRHLNDNAQTATALLALGELQHRSGRDDAAQRPLEEARRLLTARGGPPHPRVAEIDRVLGEIAAARGDTAALARLTQAARNLRSSYGAEDPRTRQAELARARQQALIGDAEGLKQLDAWAKAGETGTVPLAFAWRAAAYAAHARCARSPSRSLLILDMLTARSRQIYPEGGSLVRELEGLRVACSGPVVVR